MQLNFSEPQLSEDFVTIFRRHGLCMERRILRIFPAEYERRCIALKGRLEDLN